MNKAAPGVAVLEVVPTAEAKAVPAEVMLAYLLGSGVKKSKLFSAGQKEDRLPVQSPDGRREPQSRRVESEFAR